MRPNVKHASDFLDHQFVVPFDMAALHFEMFPKDFLDKVLDLYHAGKLKVDYQRDKLIDHIKQRNWSKNRRTMACKFVNFLYYLRNKRKSPALKE